MRKRMRKKRIKKQALHFLKEAGSSLSVRFCSDDEKVSIAGYYHKEKAILINPQGIYSFYSYLKNDVSFSFQEYLRIVIAHEYGHSTKSDRDAYYLRYDELFDDDYDNLSLSEQSQRRLSWFELVFEEEMRAWKVAEALLSDIGRDELHAIIEICMEGYHRQIEREKNEWRFYKDMQAS